MICLPLYPFVAIYIDFLCERRLAKHDVIFFTPRLSQKNVFETIPLSFSLLSFSHQKRASGQSKHRSSSSNAIPIDLSAAMLASLDERAYSRDLLRDANSLLDNIVFPMSFPWTHPMPPVAKTIPYDIDEMYGIRSAGMEHLEDGSRGKLEEVSVSAAAASSDDEQEDDDETSTTEPLLPPGTRASTRRSADPGIIEYTTVSPPNASQKLWTSPLLRTDYTQHDDPGVPGELSLREFEETQARKRRREGADTVNLRTKKVSIRFGSTSSRSSIFDRPSSKINKTPILLEASLPASVQEGTKVKQSELCRYPYLGSYDCRQSAGHPQSRAKNGLIKTGRTRLIWTSQGHKSSANRAYRNVLTGQYVENGSQKRPLAVKVGIRVNGCLVEAVPTTTSLHLQEGQTLVDQAVDLACSKSQIGGSHAQCSLDPEQLLSNITKNCQENKFPQGITPPFSIGLSTRKSIALPVLQVKPPKIDCFPCEDGLVYVACSGRGSLSVLAPSKPLPYGRSGHSNATCILMDITATDREMCSVCWSTSGPDIEDSSPSLLKCHRCELTVHRACYGGYLPANGSKFKCDSCREYECLFPGKSIAREAYKYHRWNLICSYCKQKGGSSMIRTMNGWAHDVCRTWSSSELVPPPYCCLCDGNTRPIVQCAAKNCQVMFHPMCALVSSNASDLKRLSFRNNPSLRNAAKSELEKVVEHDMFLCTQFKLAKIEVGSVDVAAASKGCEGESVSTTAPIAFCGFHNPDRRADLFGLYPGGRHLEGAMRIPPR